jgi:D-arabinose 1-dehydrogenase-like Zn-dependent alcohol dehydrogenase
MLATDLTAEELQKNLDVVEKGEMKIWAGKTFSFSELQGAHRLMDSNLADGKIVVTI